MSSTPLPPAPAVTDDEEETLIPASTSLPPDVYEAAEAEAIQEERTLAAQLRRIIKKHYRNAAKAVRE